MMSLIYIRAFVLVFISLLVVIDINTRGVRFNVCQAVKKLIISVFIVFLLTDIDLFCVCWRVKCIFMAQCNRGRKPKVGGWLFVKVEIVKSSVNSPSIKFAINPSHAAIDFQYSEMASVLTSATCNQSYVTGRVISADIQIFFLHIGIVPMLRQYKWIIQKSMIEYFDFLTLEVRKQKQSHFEVRFFSLRPIAIMCIIVPESV